MSRSVKKSSTKGNLILRRPKNFRVGSLIDVLIIKGKQSESKALDASDDVVTPITVTTKDIPSQQDIIKAKVINKALTVNPPKKDTQMPLIKKINNVRVGKNLEGLIVIKQ